MEKIKIIEFVLKRHTISFELKGTFIETTDASWCVKRAGQTDNYVIPKSSIEFIHTYEIDVCDAPIHLKMSDELMEKLMTGKWGLEND